MLRIGLRHFTFSQFKKINKLTYNFSTKCQPIETNHRFQDLISIKSKRY